MTDLYRLAREVTDEILGEGSYGELNKDHPNPKVRAEVEASLPHPRSCLCRGVGSFENTLYPERGRIPCTIGV